MEGYNTGPPPPDGKGGNRRMSFHPKYASQKPQTPKVPHLSPAQSMTSIRRGSRQPDLVHRRYQGSHRIGMEEHETHDTHQHYKPTAQEKKWEAMLMVKTRREKFRENLTSGKSSRALTRHMIMKNILSEAYHDDHLEPLPRIHPESQHPDQMASSLTSSLINNVAANHSSILQSPLAADPEWVLPLSLLQQLLDHEAIEKERNPVVISPKHEHARRSRHSHDHHVHQNLHKKRPQIKSFSPSQGERHTITKSEIEKMDIASLAYRGKISHEKVKKGKNQDGHITPRTPNNTPRVSPSKKIDPESKRDINVTPTKGAQQNKVKPKGKIARWFNKFSRKK